MMGKPNVFGVCEYCGGEFATYRPPSAKVVPRFCGLKCLGQAQRGPANPAFSGGRHKDLAGYVRVLAPDHPEADCRGYVFEHRLVAAQTLGRALLPNEVVHHINEVKDDNSPDNLRVFASQADHIKHHAEISR